MTTLLLSFRFAFTLQAEPLDNLPPNRYGVDHIRDAVAPFFNKYCVSCHDAQTKESGLDLDAYVDAASVVIDQAWRSMDTETFAYQLGER